MWEYKTLNYKTVTIPEWRLKELGLQNWELINILHIQKNGVVYYFKRQKE